MSGLHLLLQQTAKQPTASFRRHERRGRIGQLGRSAPSPERHEWLAAIVAQTAEQPTASFRRDERHGRIGWLGRSAPGSLEVWRAFGYF